MKLRTIAIIVIVGGLAYVVGSRAGRGPYEQVASDAKQVWNSPGVKRARKEAKRDLKRAGRKLTS